MLSLFYFEPFLFRVFSISNLFQSLLFIIFPTPISSLSYFEPLSFSSIFSLPFIICHIFSLQWTSPTLSLSYFERNLLQVDTQMCVWVWCVCVCVFPLCRVSPIFKGPFSVSSIFSLIYSRSFLFSVFPTLSLSYGVATISRMLKNVGLDGKRALQKRPIFYKEICIFKHPTNRSQPIFWVTLMLTPSPKSHFQSLLFWVSPIWVFPIWIFPILNLSYFESL